MVFWTRFGRCFGEPSEHGAGPGARLIRGAAFITKRINGFEPIRLLGALNDRGAREHGGCFRSGREERNGAAGARSSTSAFCRHHAFSSSIVLYRLHYETAARACPLHSSLKGRGASWVLRCLCGCVSRHMVGEGEYADYNTQKALGSHQSIRLRPIRGGGERGGTPSCCCCCWLLVVLVLTDHVCVL